MFGEELSILSGKETYNYVKDFCTDRRNKYGINKQTCKGCRYRYRSSENVYATCMFGNMPADWKNLDDK